MGRAPDDASGVLARVGRGHVAVEAPCAEFCQTARKQFQETCPNAGGGTDASFACDPRGDENGVCAFSAACARTTGQPDGPADAELCQRNRELPVDLPAGLSSVDPLLAGAPHGELCLRQLIRTGAASGILAVQPSPTEADGASIVGRPRQAHRQTNLPAGMNTGMQLSPSLHLGQPLAAPSGSFGLV